MAASPETTTSRRLPSWEEVDLYRFFACAFGAPTRDRWAWLQQPVLGPCLEELWRMLGRGEEFPEWALYESYEEYEASYLALFEVGLPEPPIPLVESGHYKSQPAQQVGLEATLFYEVVGLRASPRGYPLDHLVTQLEFLSAVRYLGEQASGGVARWDLSRLERDFLARHVLKWVPTLERKLRREPLPLFGALAALLLNFLKAREAELKLLAPSSREEK